MDALLLMEERKDIEMKCLALGFKRVLFVNRDFVVIETTQKKDLLLQTKKAKNEGKIVLFRPSSEDLLRFALEKSAVDAVFGIEKIHAKDNVHFLRGGLDPVLCKLAASKNKKICFSFCDVLECVYRGQRLGRMALNVLLAQKYGASLYFGLFVQYEEQLRSAHDLLALFRLIGLRQREEMRFLK